MGNVRHGDLALIQEATIDGKVVRFDKLPANLEAAKTDVLMKGSHGNDHAFEGGTFYPTKDGRYPFLIGYFAVMKNCVLRHPDHGEKAKGRKLRTAKVLPGVYGVIGQHEDTHTGMVQVVD